MGSTFLVACRHDKLETVRPKGPELKSEIRNRVWYRARMIHRARYDDNDSAVPEAGSSSHFRNWLLVMFGKIVDIVKILRTNDASWEMREVDSKLDSLRLSPRPLSRPPFQWMYHDRHLLSHS